MLLTNDQIDRYKAQINLKKINIQGQIKIHNSKVLIIGAGGIGSPAILFLARAGVLNIGVVDHDKVSKSNLHRQIFFDQKDIGQKKVLVTKNKIRHLDKKIQINIFNKKINESNLKSIIKSYDYIIDGTDNFKSKLNINDVCAKFKKKLFIGAVSQFDAHIFFFDFQKNGSCLRCFMPSEPKVSPRCQDEGILGTVTGTAGTIIANELIKDVTDIGSSLVNKGLIINFENLQFRKIQIKKSNHCKNHV